MTTLSGVQEELSHATFLIQPANILKTDKKRLVYKIDPSYADTLAKVFLCGDTSALNPAS
jgi:hypothetical protein